MKPTFLHPKCKPMLDLRGDLYDPSPLEITHKPEAIGRQRRTTDRVHALGGEVLMSSHTQVPMPSAQAVEHALALESRGADLVKIAMSVLDNVDAAVARNPHLGTGYNSAAGE